MNFIELKQELDSGKVRNFYIFTGPEKEVLNKYIKRVNEKPQRASSFKKVEPKLTTRNLFTPKQTYVIEDDKDASEMDAKSLKKLVGNNTLILVYDKIDKRKKLFKTAKNDIVEFKRFTDQQLMWYVKKIIDVPDNVAEMIARYCGNDVARIENECHKLKFLDVDITEGHVKKLIVPPVEDRIFDMIDYVAKKKSHEAFQLYYDLIELKTSPIQIVTLLYMKFKQVFLVQSYFNLPNVDIAGKTGMTFFQVNVSRQLVGAFTVEQILEYMKQIQQVEEDIKTGKVDQYVGMEALLINILK